jgi:hypothetical protein
VVAGRRGEHPTRATTSRVHVIFNLATHAGSALAAVPEFKSASTGTYCRGRTLARILACFSHSSYPVDPISTFQTHTAGRHGPKRFCPHRNMMMWIHTRIRKTGRFAGGVCSSRLQRLPRSEPTSAARGFGNGTPGSSRCLECPARHDTP